MAKAMASLGTFSLVLLLALAMAGAAPGPNSISNNNNNNNINNGNGNVNNNNNNGNGNANNNNNNGNGNANNNNNNGNSNANNNNNNGNGNVNNNNNGGNNNNNTNGSNGNNNGNGNVNNNNNNGNGNVNNNNNNGNGNVNNNNNNGNNNQNNNNNNGNNNQNSNGNNGNNNQNSNGNNGNNNQNNNNNGNNDTPTNPPPPAMPPPPPTSGGSTPPNAPPTNMPPPSSGSNTPPPTWYPPPPPPSEVQGVKRVRCKDRNYPQCYVLEQSCPSACPSTCEVDCVTCKPVCSCDYPGAVCQDPRFIGGDGITFYFHGKKNRDFCLVSDSNLHINAHFIGRRSVNMGRDFTWVQSIGILFGSHNLFVGALKTSAWDDAIDRLSLYLDGTPITLPQHEGALWHSETTPRISFTRYRDTNAIEIEVEKNFKIKAMVVPITRKDSSIHNYGITDEDCFAHLDVSFKFYALSGDVSGVLGQTYARNYVSRAKMGVAMPVLGGEREFASSGLFTTDCAASRFIGQLVPRNSIESFEYADLECAGGVEGRGVVCKR
ncbi:merozoite surface antigen 2-like [Eucalyptus grandis]|uniref:merozoite surface antigen 2-like n=1 Tax=Eucalyptus grandis TaxID=71139 RepID=UPI00192F0F04|nr:merozoite surface antigen 2-like [Eucalyptus grandis]